jgi:hypothetical protein
MISNVKNNYVCLYYQARHLLQKLVSSAFALFFTEISVARGTDISVKSSVKADGTS